ncbi:hypothetical protein Tco_0311814 [Tanacetum coccineum]
MGYNDVPPPPTGLFAPPTIDLSNSGLKEFQQPEFEGYGFKENKGVCENSSNEIKKTTDALIIEDWVSDCDEDESEVRIEVNSVNTAKGNKVTSVVGEQGINAVKSSACWCWLYTTQQMVINSPCLIDKKELAIPGQTATASVRRHLQLADADGISSLPNTEIFDQLTLMGYVSNDDKLTFEKGVHIPLFDTMLIHDQPGQGDGPTLTVESQHTPIASLSTSQPTTSQLISSQEQPSQVPITEPITVSFTTSHPTQTPSLIPHDSPFLGGHTPRSDEASKKLYELTELCTKLSDKVTSLEDDLKQTKKLYGKDLTKLAKKVKQLEAELKSTTEKRKARMIIFDDEEDLVSEDTSKQGRITETEYEKVEIDLNQTDDDLQRRSIIEEIDLGKGFTLQQLTPIKVIQGEEQCQESSEAQLSVLITAKILTDASRERVKTYTRRRSTDSLRDSTARGLFSTTEEVQVQERQSDTIKRYQTLKKKPVSVAQARKNMMIYLKNMTGYKMGYFKGMSYDKIRPVFEEEYNKIQTLFKKDTEVEKTKTKRIAEETLLQESFKELRTAGALRPEPIQEQPTEEPKELSEE